MRASIRLGRILGIPIEVNFSWILIFALLTYLLVGQFDDSRLGWPLAQRWGVAMITVVLFFLSVLAHELSHSAMALYKGIPVRGITLFIFGGVSQLDKEPVSPRIELAVALIGPLISIVLASIFGLAWYLLGRGDSPLEVVLLLLAWTNLSLGVFNLVPGYPLDGGRLLRAGIWGITGNHYKATWIAARMGQAIGLSIVSGGVLLAIFTGVVDGIWLGCIGMFLFFMARHSFPK
jgi:Zn-dependent protease